MLSRGFPYERMAQTAKKLLPPVTLELRVEVVCDTIVTLELTIEQGTPKGTPTETKSDANFLEWTPTHWGRNR